MKPTLPILLFAVSIPSFAAKIFGIGKTETYKCLRGLDAMGASPQEARLWSTESDAVSGSPSEEILYWSHPETGQLTVITPKFNYECQLANPKASQQNLRLELPGSGLTDQFLVYSYGSASAGFAKPSPGTVKVDQEVACVRTADRLPDLSRLQLQIHAHYFRQDDTFDGDRRIEHGKAVIAQQVNYGPDRDPASNKNLLKHLEETLDTCANLAGDSSKDLARETLQVLKRDVFASESVYEREKLGNH